MSKDHARRKAWAQAGGIAKGRGAVFSRLDVAIRSGHPVLARCIPVGVQDSARLRVAALGY